MVKSTLIVRVADKLPLAASMDDGKTDKDLAKYKEQAKEIFKKLNSHSEPSCSIESGPYTLHYYIESGICYLCISDQAFPRKLAFSYLKELSDEFTMSYGDKAREPKIRPYAFIKFDTFIQKTKRIYEDSRTQQNLSRLNEDLQDVTKIMSKNMEDLLWRGDSLDRMNTLSDQLRDQSLKYRRDARKLNLEALYRKYGIPAAIILAVLLIIYIRYKFF
ncbi:SNAP receptor [Mycoemilia scoparia]|uniref:Protein transport protein SEC22 n=1 Tax=Mycoemilia scoparia TaxID=417184 RepID=A0A9W8A043_9FUNG|nr:SNAP receptor [Mycoemilia scoparia]